MDENLQENAVQETTDTNDTNNVDEMKPMEVTTQGNDFQKKVIPVIKSKAFLVGLAILIYTIIVASITVKIDRKIIAQKILFV